MNEQCPCRVSPLSVTTEWSVISRPSSKYTSTYLKSSVLEDLSADLPQCYHWVAWHFKTISQVEHLSSDQAVSPPSVITKQTAISISSSEYNYQPKELPSSETRKITMQHLFQSVTTKWSVISR